MTTKTKTVRKNKTSKIPYSSSSSTERRTIENRDLNEDEQQQRINAESQADLISKDSSLGDPDDQGRNTVEREEDNEQMRKEEEERGNEQV